MDVLKGIANEKYSPDQDELEAIGGSFVDSAKKGSQGHLRQRWFPSFARCGGADGFSVAAVEHMQREKLRVVGDLLESIHDDVYGEESERI